MTRMIKVATDEGILQVHALRELVQLPHNAHSRPACMMLTISAFVQTPCATLRKGGGGVLVDSGET